MTYDSSEDNEHGERAEVILARVKEQMQDWRHVSLYDVNISLLNGMSNACYKVFLEPGVELADPDTPRQVLYRKFENDHIDKKIEEVIFRTMSAKRMGPRFIFQNSEYRIEQFIEGRPLSIWEMRNPHIMKIFAKAVHDMHEKSGVREAI